MTFEEAVLKSIKAYYNGKQPKELLAVQNSKKYSKEFFDNLEEQLLGGKKAKKKKGAAND